MKENEKKEENNDEKDAKKNFAKRLDQLILAFFTDPDLRSQFFFSAGYWEGMEFGVKKVTSRIIAALSDEFEVDQDIIDTCIGAQNRLLMDYRLV
jgi:hypothetical protein